MIDYQEYKISYYLVEYIIEKYGKEAVIKISKLEIHMNVQHRQTGEQTQIKKYLKSAKKELDDFC